METEKVVLIHGISEGVIVDVIDRALAAGYDIVLSICPVAVESKLKVEPELCVAPAAKDGPRLEKGVMESESPKCRQKASVAKGGRYMARGDRERRIVEAWRPGMTLTDLAVAAGVSRSSLGRDYRRVLSAEQVRDIEGAISRARCESGRLGGRKGRKAAAPAGDVVMTDDGDGCVTEEYRQGLREQLHYEFDNLIF
jgi:hypothetical protein